MRNNTHLFLLLSRFPLDNELVQFHRKPRSECCGLTKTFVGASLESLLHLTQGHELQHTTMFQHLPQETLWWDRARRKQHPPSQALIPVGRLDFFPMRKRARKYALNLKSWNKNRNTVFLHLDHLTSCAEINSPGHSHCVVDPQRPAFHNQRVQVTQRGPVGHNWRGLPAVLSS